jgi:CheY-like chemotaxis protein
MRMVGTTLAERNVVIIDDDERHQFAFAAELTALGWTVHAAPGGAAGVELSRIVKPPLIFVDLQMPEMDGFQACELLRAEPWCKNTVIIAASGLARYAVEERAMRSGFDLYLLKPFSENLVQKILAQTAQAAGLL